MTEANSINAATTGIVGNTGTSFTGTAVTQYNVITGAATTSTLNNVAPSATTGVPLISQGNAAQPIFGTALVAGGGTAATTFNTNGVVISNTTATGALAALSLTSGQVVIGGTTTPAAATLTAGTGVSIVNGNNSITINASGVGLNWSDNSGTFTAAANNGYFITAASTPTLPASPVEGSTVAFAIDTASTCTVTANTGQKIRIGTAVSANAGTAANNAIGDSILLVFRTSDSVWFSVGAPQGIWTVT
jgi:hypothetical protein